MSDPYEVLGLPRFADEAEIRRRYLELVRQFSPDRDPSRFAEILRLMNRSAIPTACSSLSCSRKTRRIRSRRSPPASGPGFAIALTRLLSTSCCHWPKPHEQRTRGR